MLLLAPPRRLRFHRSLRRTRGAPRRTPHIPAVCGDGSTRSGSGDRGDVGPRSPKSARFLRGRVRRFRFRGDRGVVSVLAQRSRMSRERECRPNVASLECEAGPPLAVSRRRSTAAITSPSRQARRSGSAAPSAGAGAVGDHSRHASRALGTRPRATRGSRRRRRSVKLREKEFAFYGGSVLLDALTEDPEWSKERPRER